MTLSRGFSVFRGIRLGSSACPSRHSLLCLSSYVEQLMLRGEQRLLGGAELRLVRRVLRIGIRAGSAPLQCR